MTQATWGWLRAGSCLEGWLSAFAGARGKPVCPYFCGTRAGRPAASWAREVSHRVYVQNPEVPEKTMDVTGWKARLRTYWSCVGSRSATTLHLSCSSLAQAPASANYVSGLGDAALECAVELNGSSGLTTDSKLVALCSMQQMALLRTLCTWWPLCRWELLSRSALTPGSYTGTCQPGADFALL